MSFPWEKEILLWVINTSLIVEVVDRTMNYLSSWQEGSSAHWIIQCYNKHNLWQSSSVTCKNWFSLIIGFHNNATMLTYLLMYLTVITVNFIQPDQRFTVFNPYFSSVCKRNQWKPCVQWPVTVGHYVCIVHSHKHPHTRVPLHKCLDINNSLVLLFPSVFLTTPQNVETSNCSKNNFI